MTITSAGVQKVKLREWLKTNVTEIHTEKLAKILLAIFIMVSSVFVLPYKIPESKYVQETLESLEDSKTTVMKFSGATIAASLAITALPDDFGSPLANTLADMNKDFIFIFAVLYLERLIVVEGMKIAFVYIIPLACAFYILSVLTGKAVCRVFASKLAILGLAVAFVVPFSTHFTERVCEDYLVYVDETIAEADAGAGKVNEVMASGDEEAGIFEKLTDAFKTAIRGVSDLKTYFGNVLKKCVNSIAIMIVTTFVLPMLVLLLFRWLLKELFSLSLPSPRINTAAAEERNAPKAIEAGADPEKTGEK